jgi:homoserine kinase type II
MAPAASARLRDQLASLPEIDSEPQLIHNDYRASNILTSGSEIIAVLDFDDIALDYCVSDLANAFVLLSTRFTNWQPTPARVRDAFLDGYQSVRSLTRLEHQWLHALVLLRGIKAIPPGDDPAGWALALLGRGPASPRRAVQGRCIGLGMEPAFGTGGRVSRSV